MIKDFSIDMYKELLSSLQDAGYQFITFSQYIRLEETNTLPTRFIILRHDVDDLPQNSMDFADIQAQFKVKGTFYFRIVPRSFDKAIIRKMLNQGHEVGYHYETMDTSSGNVDEAYEEFLKHLKTFEGIHSVETISMHGSPLSKFDNRDIWRKYNYKDLGLIGEPYFDFNFNEVLYITDTGRAWDGHKYNIRDRAPRENPLTNPDFINRSYHSTSDIISAIREGSFPCKVMMNFHPERWTNNNTLWLKQLLNQFLKNQVKRIIVLSKS
jgi:hypothetical protein